MKKNRELQRRAEAVIAHGALTNSKRPQSFVRPIYPTHLRQGLDARVQDVDERWYVDYICGLGAHLFGYRNERITRAVLNQISASGTVFSLGSELEVEVAEAFRDRFPQLQRMRFLKTASEACSAAIRIARSYTGREVVLSEGYHGWHDDFVSLTPPASGVPTGGIDAGRDWIYGMEKEHMLPGAAAVIVEPVITDQSDQRIQRLHALRRICTQHDILLIFDETITGLRYPGLSVAKAIGIDPDLTIMGKAIGGGYPLALVGGRADVMECEYFVSSTFAGDCVALAAAREVLRMLAEPGLMEQLWVKGAAFCTRFNELAPDLIRIEGYGTRGTFQADAMTKALFFQECCKAGILFGPSFFYGTTHHHHDTQVLDVCRVVLSRIRNNQVKLEGSLPATPYAQKVRQQ